MKKFKKSLTKGDRAMLVAARMQILLEKNMQWVGDREAINDADISPRSKLLKECYNIIKKAKIPKKYLIAESLDNDPKTSY